VLKKLLRIFIFIGFTLTLSACHKETILAGYIEGEYTNVASNLSGILIKLLVQRGQEVRGGQLLYQLDPLPQSAQLEQAKKDLESEKNRLVDLELSQRSTIIQSILAQIEQAKANLDLSKINYTRFYTLLQQRAIDKATVDNAYYVYMRDLKRVNELIANLSEAKLGAREFLIKTQQEKVQSAEATVIAAQWALSQKTIYAPVTGLIYDTYYRVGEFVPERTPVVVMLAPQNIYLVFYMPEPQRNQLKVGQTVHFDCDDCKQRFAASVSYISPQAEYTPPVIYSRDSRSKLVFRIKARLLLPHGVYFYPGQPVNVYLN
jgi:HlyD family secretion protein